MKHFPEQAQEEEYVPAMKLAATLGITELGLSKLGKAGVLVRKPDPERRRTYVYLYETNIARYIARIQEPMVEAQRVYALERARTERLKGDKLSIEVSTRNGVLVPAETLMAQLDEGIGVFRRRLLAVPARVAGMFAESEEDRRTLKAMLEREVNDSLSMLAGAWNGRRPDSKTAKPTR